MSKVDQNKIFATLKSLLAEALDKTNASGNPVIPEPKLATCAGPHCTDNDHEMKWSDPSCQSLARTPIPEESLDSLFDGCLDSLVKKVLNGNENFDNNDFSERKRLFSNMLDDDKLNPQEQRFLAMVLTSFGETRGQKSYSVDEIIKEGERFQRIMKVIDNRTNRYREIYTNNSTLGPMETVLIQKQFSPYNSGDPNLPKMLNYKSNSNNSMKNAVLAYIQYQNRDRQVPHIPPDTFHFVAQSCRPMMDTSPCSPECDWCQAPKLTPPDDPHHAFLKLEDEGLVPPKYLWTNAEDDA